VVGEEFGLIACLALMLLFAFVVLRVLARAKAEPDPFPALAMTGLVTVFGFQAVINMAVNVSLLPAKGMTLPFISAGGSSLLAVSLTIGMALALTRRRPQQMRHKKPRLTPTMDELGFSGQSPREEY
jgi:cell division protein FtsW